MIIIGDCFCTSVVGFPKACFGQNGIYGHFSLLSGLLMVYISIWRGLHDACLSFIGSLDFRCVFYPTFIIFISHSRTTYLILLAPPIFLTTTAMWGELSWERVTGPKLPVNFQALLPLEFSGDIGWYIFQCLLHFCARLKHIHCNTIFPTFKFSLVILTLKTGFGLLVIAV